MYHFKLTFMFLVAVGNQPNQHRMFHIRLRNADSSGQIKDEIVV